MMRTAVMIFGAAALLLAGLLRLRAQLRSPHPGAGHLGAAALAAGVALLLHTPGVYQWCDRVAFHYPNGSALASFLLTVAGVGAAAEMVAGLVGAPHVLARLSGRGTAVAVAVAMMVAFALAGRDREDPWFFEHHRHDPHLAVFWIVFCTSVAFGTAYIAAAMRRVARGDDRQVARGLRLIGYGSACVAVFLTGCLLQVAVPAIPTVADALGQAVLVAGGFLLACGVLWPQLATWRQRSVECRRLQPLWATVTSRYPYVRSQARRRGLYRTVIEIEDAVAEARTHRQVDTPLLRALDALTAHRADEFDVAVREMLQLAAVSRTMTL